MNEPSNNPPDELRLRKLLDIALSGAQTDNEALELRELLDQRPDLRPAVAEQLRVHSLLQWEMARPSSDDAGSLCGPAAVAEPAPRADVSRRAWGVWIVTLAAALGGVMLWSALPRGGAATASIGQITPGTDLRLATNTSAVVDADGLVPGVLGIDAGSLAIKFASGVEMDITGPAECEVLSGMRVRLTHGQATAQVPRWARGFTIETPDVGVVDLGTRFGVAREPNGKTDVVVFEGEVDLKSLPSNTAKPFERRLVQGEAARIDRDGAMERVFQVHGDWTGNGWSTSRPAGHETLISAVWDNLWASKSVSYYQVLPGGLVEDAAAYVDHPHEWNGIDESGLPDFLRGAEYVRTVNDFRYLGELAIQLEIAQDANLYVLFDQRVAAPAWLKAAFEDTGEQVGLDEDAWHGNPGFTVESGAGRSIDNTFSVWRRSCRAGEVVLLGSVGDGREARAMYGVAATPR